MSAPKLRIVLTERAVGDIRSIQRVTSAQWSSDQAVASDEAIHHALEALRDHPTLGRNRADLLIRVRSYPVLSHTFFYRIAIAGDSLVV